ncbi:MAG TPA: mersacidin/lichenicidin family type 2 lantibiotic [Herpetosiphonaceae bacterium]
MSIENIIRAWKDEEYRASLSETERAALPEHPAGLVELTDEELGLAAGGCDTEDWRACSSYCRRETCTDYVCA